MCTTNRLSTLGPKVVLNADIGCVTPARHHDAADAGTIVAGMPQSQSSPRLRLDERASRGLNSLTVKNITISVDDETYRRARIKAAEQDTSVSALVKRFLVELAAGESDVERLKREERALREQIKTFTAADRLSRNDTHERGT